MKTIKYTIIVVMALFWASCEKETAQEGDTIPEITSIATSRDTINFGGDKTTITVIASGGNLQYTWDVDLGDIFPTGQEGVVEYSGSSCCIGLKTIKCTVSNSMGEVKSSIDVFILEPEN